MRHATLPSPEKSENITLFQCLKPAEFAAVHARMSYRVFRAGEQILQQDQPGDEVFFIDYGCVKICHSNVSRALDVASQMHREVILTVVGKGAILGELSVLDGKGTSASAEALEATACFVLNAATFRQVLQMYPALRSALLSQIADYARLNARRMEILALHNVAGAIAGQLLLCAERCGQEQPDGTIFLPLPLMQSTLAGLTGHTRESVNRTLKRFEKAGWIVLLPRYRILLRDSAALRHAYLGTVLSAPSE